MKKAAFISIIFLVTLCFLPDAHAERSADVKQKIRQLRMQHFYEHKVENGEEKNKQDYEHKNFKNNPKVEVKSEARVENHPNVKVAKFESQKFKIEKPQFNREALKIHNQFRNTPRIQKINFIGR